MRRQAFGVLLVGLIVFSACGSFDVCAEPFSGIVGLSGSLTIDTDFSEAIATLGSDTTPDAFFPTLSFSEFQLGPSFFGGSGIRTRISPNPFVTSGIYSSIPSRSIALLIRDNVPTRMTIFRQGVAVETLLTAGLGFNVQRYYGFKNVHFDAIEFSHDAPPLELDDRYLGIDRFQVVQYAKRFAIPFPLIAQLIFGGLICGIMLKRMLKPC